MYWFVLAPCRDLQVVCIAKPYKTVIPPYTWSVTWQSCPPSVVPKGVEFYPGTTMSVSLLVHLSACPRGLDVWRRQCVLFRYITGPTILLLFCVVEMAEGLTCAAWPECCISNFTYCVYMWVEGNGYITCALQHWTGLKKIKTKKQKSNTWTLENKSWEYFYHSKY